ncbi:MAG: LEA type 2 family protein [Bacteroidetes bacterium]|nr:LEA type 2 family protein [Bacteroidota bacterium]
MKRYAHIVISVALIALLSSCKVYPPVYKRVDNFGIHKLDKDGFRLSGELVFYNPNKFRFHLNEILMNVEVEGKHIATAGQLQPVLINKVSEFNVPLDLVIKPDMNWNEIIKGIMNILKNKQIDMTISGTVVVRAFGVKIPITIKENEKIDITKLK